MFQIRKKLRKSAVELLLVVLVMAAFYAVQINAIVHDNYAGQDFQRHKMNISWSIDSPLKALTAPLTVGMCTPTLYHYLGGVVVKLFSDFSPWRTVAFFNLIINTVALLLFYVLIHRVISSPMLRISCFLLITLLPVTVITSLVIGSDAIMLLSFISLVWILIMIKDRLELGQSPGYLLATASILFVLSYLFKYPYVINLVGAVVVGVILIGNGMLGGRRMWEFLIIVIFLPSLLFVSLYAGYIRFQTPFHRDKGIVRTQDKSMSARSIVFFRQNDLQLLDAPYFHQVMLKNGVYSMPLQEANYFSYPALLHLGTFTDVLNMYEPIVYSSDDPVVLDEYYSRVRTPLNLGLMQIAVKTAILFSVVAFICMFCFFVKAVLSIVREDRQVDMTVIILLVMSLCLFAGMTVTLPTTDNTYNEGYWLPRLVMPLLVSFFVITYHVLDRSLNGRFKWLQWVVLTASSIQSIMHVAFLWVRHPV